MSGVHGRVYCEVTRDEGGGHCRGFVSLRFPAWLPSRVVVWDYQIEARVDDEPWPERRPDVGMRRPGLCREAAIDDGSL